VSEASLPLPGRAYLERLAAPRRQGDLEPADAAGEVGSVVGGLGVRVTLRFSKDPASPRRIASVRWRSLGSLAATGPAEVLAEVAVGCDEAGARAIGAADLLGPLGPDLPPAVVRAADRVVEALALALGGGRAAASVMSPGMLVCRCLSVGDRAIRRAIRQGAEDIESIGIACAAGQGCHTCWPDLRELLDDERVRARPPVGPLGPRLPRSTDPLLAAVDAIVRPLWRAQGVTLGRVERGGDGVRLEILWVASGALASEIGAIALARHALRQTIAEGLRVEPCPPVHGSEAPGPSGRS